MTKLDKSALEAAAVAAIFPNTTNQISASTHQTFLLNLIDSLLGNAEYAEKTSAYTITDDDVVIGGDTTSTGFTITLPAAASVAGRFFIILRTAGANTLTIDGDGAETINGAANKTITTTYEALVVFSNGTSWFGWTLTAA